MEPRKFEELSEAEIQLRNLIYAVQVKDKHHPAHPIPLGNEWLAKTLAESIDVAEKAGIPLVEVKY